MNSALSLPLAILGWIALAIVLGFVLYKVLSGVFWVFGRVFAGIGWFVRHVATFVAGMISDALRVAGGLLTAFFYVLAVAFNTLFARLDRAAHYGRALDDEVLDLFACLYRLVIGHVAKLLLLTPVTEGIEKRVPEVIARAPRGEAIGRGWADALGGGGGAGRADRAGSAARGGRPGSGSADFDGYRVIAALQAGGSGARLWLAEPGEGKRRQLAAAGRPAPAQVVIKSFSLEDGSTLPQIVRENRALVAARDLGLVLEHELTAHRFHYVMPYVPGEDLATVTARLHASAGSAGLDDEGLRRVVGYATDLLATLERFHAADLWHKDVKPGNIIVSDERVHLVDLGLITPLRSAMTLTTHGTEYFRDPEMVRLALRGVKVHEVDGAKFDVYGAGAVLFSLIENGFPAHGSLSRLTKRCPEALQHVVRRAMAELSQRYGSAHEMLADLAVLAAARDPFAVRPADLPSLSGQVAASTIAGAAAAAAGAAGAGGPAGAAGAAGAGNMEPAGGAAAIPAATVGGAAAGQAASARGAFRGIAIGMIPPGEGGDERTVDGEPDDTRRGRRRWHRVRERHDDRARPRRRSGLLVVCILAGLAVSGLFFQGPGRAVRFSHITTDLPFQYEVDLPPAPVPSAGQTGKGRLAATEENDTSLAVARAQLEDAHVQVLASLSLDNLDRMPTVIEEPAVGRANQTAPANSEAPTNVPTGTILVLDDLPAGAAAAQRQAIDQLFARLRAESFALIGAAPTGAVPTGAALPADAEIELLAGARTVVGLSDPSDDEVVARLATFLREQQGTLDAILWIGRGDDGRPVHARAVARTDEIAARLARILGR